jgi:hypothetical protein
MDCSNPHLACLCRLASEAPLAASTSVCHWNALVYSTSVLVCSTRWRQDPLRNHLARQSPGYAWKPNDAIAARTRDCAALVAQTRCPHDDLAGIPTGGEFLVQHRCVGLVFVTEGCRASLERSATDAFFSTPHSSARIRSVLSQTTIPPVSTITTPEAIKTRDIPNAWTRAASAKPPKISPKDSA